MSFVPLPSFQPAYLQGYIPAKREGLLEKTVASALGSAASKGVDALLDKYLVTEEDQLRRDLLREQILGQQTNQYLAAGQAALDDQTAMDDREQRQFMNEQMLAKDAYERDRNEAKDTNDFLSTVSAEGRDLAQTRRFNLESDELERQSNANALADAKSRAVEMGVPAQDLARLSTVQEVDAHMEKFFGGLDAPDEEPEGRQDNWFLRLIGRGGEGSGETPPEGSKLPRETRTATGEPRLSIHGTPIPEQYPHERVQQFFQENEFGREGGRKARSYSGITSKATVELEDLTPEQRQKVLEFMERLGQ